MIGWQETILILVILLVVFGPTKLPKLARDLGKAWHEFNKASSGMIEAVSSAPTTNDKDENKLLLEVARKLDVNTERKTDEQITKEILTKLINKEEPTKNEEIP